jgi:hypothetical protein
MGQEWSGLGGSIVTVMKPTEAGMRDDATGSERSGSGGGRFLAEPEMPPVLVIMADVLSQKSFQMLFVDCDHMIEQITAATLDPTLRNSVLPGAREGSPDGSDPQGADRCGNLDTILAISVEDQKRRSRAERKRFAQLLKNPSTRGMRLSTTNLSGQNGGSNGLRQCGN